MNLILLHNIKKEDEKINIYVYFTLRMMSKKIKKKIKSIRVYTFELFTRQHKRINLFKE